MMEAQGAAPYRPGCLLVDDREENLFAHEAMLHETGAEIWKARCGDEALDLLLRHDVAVALIDVQMPGMDGLELAELMRGLERTRDVPIIFVTATQRDESKVLRGYTSGGAVDFLYKPLSPHVVLSKVRVFLELAQRRRELKANLERLERALEREEASRREVAKAHQLRDHLLAMVGHDLRTPLAAIMLSARILEEQASCPEIAPRVAGILRSSSRIAEMIEEMVDLSHAHTAGGFPLQRSELELGGLCRAVIAEIEIVHSDRAIALHADGEVTGCWDPRALSQVISNLVGNAIVHGETSPVAVSIRRVDGAAEIEVRNGGAPIPEDLLPHLFDPYRKAHATSKGLGLGLFIANEIVQAHGGSIAVRSSAAEGTCFTIRLPDPH